MSPNIIEVLGVTALVFGVVAALFALIYVWEKWVKGTRLEQRIDRFFDRIGELFDR
ncbi:hypothetical protein [Mycolicibacterium sp.]|uniref:hypothetical protein n=1 Tax=Mycolicibacterium sp. TaxID=2320850 RepID=UPI003D0CCD35